MVFCGFQTIKITFLWFPNQIMETESTFGALAFCTKQLRTPVSVPLVHFPPFFRGFEFSFGGGGFLLGMLELGSDDDPAVRIAFVQGDVLLFNQIEASGWQGAQKILLLLLRPGGAFHEDENAVDVQKSRDILQ